MKTIKTEDILVSTELAVELLEVLNEASGRGGFKGATRKKAQWCADTLRSSLRNDRGARGIRVSMEVVAFILKLLLLVALPESLVHIVMMTLEKMY